MRRGRLALLVALLLACAPRAHAAVAVVPDDFPTLQAAIESPADTIWVRPGDYPESIYLEIYYLLPGDREKLVVEGYPGTSVLDRPRLGPITVFGNSDAGPVVFRGVHFTGVTRFNSPEKASIEVAIESCAFDVGAAFVGNQVAVRGSILRGTVEFHHSTGGFTADTLQGGRITVSGEGTMGVAQCVFEGPGDVALDLAVRHMGVGINTSRFRGYTRAIAGYVEDYSLWIADNRFEDCGTAIDVTLLSQNYVLRNEVLRCGSGIILAADYHIRLLENRVQECTGVGILATLATGQADLFRNVVGDCDGDGIVLRQAADTKGVLVSNTCYGNGGSGISVDRASGDVTEVTGNIGYANGAYGLSVDSDVHVLALGCNDWFGNSLGAVSGTSPGATDLALDPRFCDVGAGDVHLRSTSPLLAVAGCDAIGALGVGCADSLTATLVLAFAADRVAGGVRLRWQVAAPLADEAWVERAENVMGPWVRIATERTAAGEHWLDLDRAASEDRAYHYRLVVREGGNNLVVAGPITVSAALDAAFALYPASPNPSRGVASLEFALPRAADVTLDVFDLQGRAVASLAHGLRAAGRHRVEWTGATSRGERAAPGVYLVRFRHPGGEVLQRLVRLD